VGINLITASKGSVNIDDTVTSVINQGV